MTDWYQGRTLMVEGYDGREVFISWWLEANSREEPERERGKETQTD